MHALPIETMLDQQRQKCAVQTYWAAAVAVAGAVIGDQKARRQKKTNERERMVAKAKAENSVFIIIAVRASV